MADSLAISGLRAGYGPLDILNGVDLDVPLVEFVALMGPNEAGKSSALAAVTDLLFGIEERTRFAFLHPMPEMRVGAEIAAADGRTLAFRRRKGRKNTLVDAADAPLPEPIGKLEARPPERAALEKFLRDQGFRSVVLMNGHGGNDAALRVAVDRLTNEIRCGAHVAATSYFHVASTGGSPASTTSSPTSARSPTPSPTRP